MSAAKEGNKRRYLTLLRTYEKVATVEADPIVQRAGRVLAEKLAFNAADKLFNVRMLDRWNVAEIRDRCRGAEDVKVAGTLVEKYVKRVRRLYDDLHEKGSAVSVTLEDIEIDGANKIQWWLGSLDASGEWDEVESAGWEAPVQPEGWAGWFRVSVQESVSLDFWTTKEVRVWVKQDQWWWYGDSVRAQSLTLADLVACLGDGVRQIRFRLGDDGGPECCVRFRSSRLPRLWRLLRDVERLEDELFRSKVE